MNVTDAYLLAPHCCFYCHGDELPALDLERDDEDNPNKVEHVYLCPVCLESAARIVLPRRGIRVDAWSVLDTAHSHIAAQQLQIAELAEQRDLALAARDALVESWKASAPPAVVELVPEGDTSRRGRRGVG